MKRSTNSTGKLSPSDFVGVWSATPTPFTAGMRIDKVAVKRLVKHHLRLGVRGLFLGGTCGEGPWMPDDERRELTRATVQAACGKLVVAVQVSDNSAARIIDNMRMAAEDGADVAIIAPPYFLLNATTENVVNLYRTAIRESPLPVGVYDRISAAVPVSDEAIRQIYAEPRVVLVKDSTSSVERREIALAARKARPELRLLNGDEFNCTEYLKAGYDGLLLGGGIFNGFLAGEIMEAVREGDIREAEKLQKRMNRLMYDVYGGKKIACWLSGLKHLLMEMGVFRTANNFLQYPLTAACRKAVAAALEREKEILFP